MTRRFIFLEEGDIAEITRRSVNIFDKTGAEVKRQDIESNLQYDAGDKVFTVTSARESTNSQTQSKTPYRAHQPRSG